jgi:peptidyl-prolyl cis-trans isomerase SurA
LVTVPKTKRFIAVLAAAAAVCGTLVQPRSASATIVERVVAVVGERPILWTELLRRATALRLQIRLQVRDPNIISVQEQEMYKELLDHMIDERLEEQQADRAHVNVTSEEIDRSIATIAAQAQTQQQHPITVQDVLAEVRRRGLSEQDFREDLRHQVLEGKLIELRVRPRVRVTEQDAHMAYQRWLQELNDQQPVEVRYLVKRIAPDATKEQYQAVTSLMRELADRARAGEDFCKLVGQYTDDTSTRDKCGSRGPQPMAALPSALQEALRTVKPGNVSDPLPVRVGQDDVLLIVMPMGRAQSPAYADVKNEMMQRALYDAVERGKKQWLLELRHKVYVDVRL